VREQHAKILGSAFKSWTEHKDRMRHRLQQAAFMALKNTTLEVLHSSSVGRRKEDQLDILVDYCLEMENLHLTSDRKVLSEFCQHARLLTLPDYSILFLQGQTGHDFYIVVSGAVKLYCYATKEGDEFPLLEKLGKRANQIQGLSAKSYYQYLGKHVYTSQEGSGFGEVSLHTEKPRDSTAVCDGRVELMIVPKSIYLRTVSANNFELRQETKEKHEFLSGLSIISDWPPSKIHRFAYKMQRREYPRRSVIASIGDEVGDVYLICSGEVSITVEAHMKVNKVLKQKKEEKKQTKQLINVEVCRGSSGFVVGDYEAMHRCLTHQNKVTCCTSVVAYSLEAPEFVAFFASSMICHRKMMKSVNLACAERSKRAKREVRRQWELRERLAAHCRAHPPSNNARLSRPGAVPLNLVNSLRKPAAPANMQTDRMAYQSMQAWTFQSDAKAPRQGREQLKMRDRSISEDLPNLNKQRSRQNSVSTPVLISPSNSRRPRTCSGVRSNLPSGRPSIVSFLEFSPPVLSDAHNTEASSALRRPSSALGIPSSRRPSELHGSDFINHSNNSIIAEDNDPESEPPKTQKGTLTKKSESPQPKPDEPNECDPEPEATLLGVVEAAMSQSRKGILSALRGHDELVCVGQSTPNQKIRKTPGHSSTLLKDENGLVCVGQSTPTQRIKKTATPESFPISPVDVEGGSDKQPSSFPVAVKSCESARSADVPLKGSLLQRNIFDQPSTDSKPYFQENLSPSRDCKLVHIPQATPEQLSARESITARESIQTANRSTVQLDALSHAGNSMHKEEKTTDLHSISQAGNVNLESLPPPKHPPPTDPIGGKPEEKLKQDSLSGTGKPQLESLSTKESSAEKPSKAFLGGFLDVVKQAHMAETEKRVEKLSKIDEWNKRFAAPSSVPDDLQSPRSPSFDSSTLEMKTPRQYFPDNPPRLDPKLPISVSIQVEEQKRPIKLPSAQKKSPEVHTLFRSPKNSGSPFCSTSSAFYCKPLMKGTQNKDCTKARCYMVSPLQSPSGNSKTSCQDSLSNVSLPYSGYMNFDSCQIASPPQKRLSIRSRLKDL